MNFTRVGMKIGILRDQHPNQSEYASQRKSISLPHSTCREEFCEERAFETLGHGKPNRENPVSIESCNQRDDIITLAHSEKETICSLNI